MLSRVCKKINALFLSARIKTCTIVQRSYVEKLEEVVKNNAPSLSSINLLDKLRCLMNDPNYVPHPLNAYIVMSTDMHNSEYSAPCDNRREYITGFTGSAGTAVILHNKALLWTDSRYFTQACNELDENWVLMKFGQVEPIDVWLTKNLPPNSAVGIDPNYIPYRLWLPLENQLSKKGHRLIPVKKNLIDPLWHPIWNKRPERTKDPLKPLPLKYTGKSAKEKISDIREEMMKCDATDLVLTALDEIAWTLNLRGSDFPYSPLFYSYLIIKHNSVTLYIHNYQNCPEVKKHLDEELGHGLYEIKNYDSIEQDLKDNTDKSHQLTWISNTANYNIVDIISKNSNINLTNITPAARLKVVKNPVEIEGMRKANIKDSVALISFFAWLEKKIQAGKDFPTEISATERLELFRREQEGFMGSSFKTISAVGANSAIVHYTPKAETNVPITGNDIFLCDSGGQYLDGTTDITRTMHFGKPMRRQQILFTLVLKGYITLASAIFPANTKGSAIDAFARKVMWELGLNYKHETGHGVGCFLNVHDGGVGFGDSADYVGLDVGMVLSIEPGYYEAGECGFRHEDVVVVVDAPKRCSCEDTRFCKFETISLVPFPRNLIVVELLSAKEIRYLDEFHKKSRETLLPFLKREGMEDAKEWLIRQTMPVKSRGKRV